MRLYVIIKPGNISVRALEALALKTIPIIIASKKLRLKYRTLGFNESNCYFITLEPTEKNVFILDNDEIIEKIAKNGLRFVRENHSWVNRAQTILEKALENDFLQA